MTRSRHAYSEWSIPGEDLYRALLRVWLGDRPTSAGLKRALLGQLD